jgi:hypothetical protein
VTAVRTRLYLGLLVAALLLLAAAGAVLGAGRRLRVAL